MLPMIEKLHYLVYIDPKSFYSDENPVGLQLENLAR